MAVIPDFARRHGVAFASYFVIGGAAAGVEWLIFAALIAIAPGYYILAAIIAFLVATYANYRLCVGTIFSSRTGSVWKDIAAVYAASLFAFLINLSVLALLINLFGINPMVSKIAGTGVAFLINFAARRFVIFSWIIRPARILNGAPPVEAEAALPGLPPMRE